ncbi:tRNA glutamyl-Q(34) synthetase GluQRS [Psychromicrobium lacuslunae]|uniref:Glutamyl-Q tRNA(Asp) synthetase n=1 Tax=Psychromicrobium lacuslunae TaxID=1618207 RepID=A0A0D4C1U5_9MICC|nr:tRNA glutamyl-Q(34) synthetase GluQRS [Psychromicrobium lacuslunae]AJT42548.1 glutamyl-Q tRNA(Asp) ligase [Psychromicrobium lacuslunae]
MPAGRFAPSPSGELHLGNLRTAVLAWLFARHTDRRFLLRIEDLDRVRAGSEAEQIRDLEAIGLDWDEAPVRQSERSELYSAAIQKLRQADLLFECFCTRRDIAEAASAPHAVPGHYPGTCLNLSEAKRASLRRERPAALRLRADVENFTVLDGLHGEYRGEVDDFVIVRNDGVAAYNLAVVIDDAGQGIDQVVRGDDLLSSAPRQAYLASLLGYQVPEYLHVPLALNPEGKRLAKRDGAVTLRQLGVEATRQLVFDSLRLPASLDQALQVFDPRTLPREPWIVRG